MTIQRSRRSDWASGEGWNGKLEGTDSGTSVSFLFNEVDEAGKGPPLHTHPYDEVHIVRRGRAKFTVGEDTIETEAGDIVVVPASTPHRVVTMGNDTTEIMSVHLSDRFEGTYLQ